jgi:hypothetical protein
VIWLAHFEKEPDYDFDESMFGITEDGKLIYGGDSGCSCPTPWDEGEDYYTSYNITEGMEIEITNYIPVDWESILTITAKRISLALTNPIKLSSSSILEEENTEVKRELINKKGMDNFISELSPEVIDENILGILLKVEIKNDEPIMLLRVKDCSTDREYFLRVPPDIKNVKEGLAWSFDLEENEYNPIIET